MSAIDSSLLAAGNAFIYPADQPGSPLAGVLKQPMLLGLFLPIHNGGWSMSTAPRETDWSFAYNAALTRQAEALGFDLAFGPANWLPKGGFGGDLKYRENWLDPLTVSAALAAVTKRILLIATIHILHGPWHPLHLAKFGATLDHIAPGRWGLNMVTGFLSSERPMFGQKPLAHDLRYRMADEFTDIMLRLWRETENLNFKGEYWQLDGAYVTPKPKYGRPLIVNATGSPAGVEYAARYSDLVFITSPAGAEIEAALAALPAHVGAIKQAAAARGRDIRTLINPMIVCRQTDAEAWDAYDEIAAAADMGAVDNFFATFSASDSKSWSNHQRGQRVVGGNIQLVGSPATIVRQLLRLKAVGVDGIQICFFDYEPELAYFGREVLPLMHQAGLRV